MNNKESIEKLKVSNSECENIQNLRDPCSHLGTYSLPVWLRKTRNKKERKKHFFSNFFFLPVISVVKLQLNYLVACIMCVFPSLKATKVHYSFDAI